jgi:hypothetical protein
MVAGRIAMAVCADDGVIFTKQLPRARLTVEGQSAWGRSVRRRLRGHRRKTTDNRRP